MADGHVATSQQADITLFTSEDLDHVRSVLNRFYYPVAVGVPDGLEGFEFDLQVIQLGPLTLGQLRFGAPVTIDAAELNAYHVTVPTVGSILARHAGHEVAAGPTKAAIFGPGGPVFVRHDPHSTELDVKIERRALEVELSALLGRPVDGPIDLPPALDLSKGPGLSWRRLVYLLRDELQDPETLIRQPLIGEQLRHSVLSGLLFSTAHRYYDELTAPAQAGTPRAVRRTLDAIRDEPERPFSVADLADIAGVSVRSLQEGFRQHVGCSPMVYLQQVRLDRTRDALLAGDPALVTVAAIANWWGFAHLGRFASVYRARFGERPSETLRAAG
ncbi:MAG TPA: AraC family transcriptional regulator [Actinoplanes sp.]|jgi:AraC-like DNA-binding protein|nr:AraC family transcriptional regulator [Actinoplanes sp.]